MVRPSHRHTHAKQSNLVVVYDHVYVCYISDALKDSGITLSIATSTSVPTDLSIH